MCSDESETLYIVPCCDDSSELWWYANHAHGTETDLLETYKRIAINLKCTAFSHSDEWKGCICYMFSHSCCKG